VAFSVNWVASDENRTKQNKKTIQNWFKFLNSCVQFGLKNYGWVEWIGF